MRRDIVRGSNIVWCFSFFVALGLTTLPVTSSDVDGDGYVGRFDSAAFVECLGGPGLPPPQPTCVDAFDGDGDGDVDAADFATLSGNLGHLPIPLKDNLGNPITLDSTRGYSGRETCGATGCHDVARISNGLVFQQGRTDTAGNIIMQDDFFGDGRWWVRSGGMYGRWSGGGGGLNRQTAGKDNPHASAMDMTAFYFSSDCGACHVGGGGMEFDRDGVRLWDEATGQFGYEVLGQGPGDVVLDGDYAYLDVTTGLLSPARWDITGVADPECLHCHRAQRTWTDDKDMHREWRAAVLGATTELVDDQGASVPAFALAGTAGQGWFSTLDTTADPPVLQIDYSVGVNPGELLVNGSNELLLATGFLARPPRDQACWGCHLAGGFQNKRGTVWFDDRDIHFKMFTKRSDDDPNNDLSDDLAAVCNTCHPNDMDHDFAKGDSPYNQFRNETDWVEFRSCRECHLTENPPGVPNPDKHPDAPDVPGSAIVHNTGGMMATLACQTCHVPYALERGILVTDRSLTGTAVSYRTDDFLSADPLDPWNPDKSKWYPELRFKEDSDGNQRLFPQKYEVAIYWADWDQNDTPYDMTDDTIQPTILWRVRQITGNAPLPGVTDDNGDGILEVNRREEIFLYIQALKGNDIHGRPVAENPVLVKGGRVWYEDAAAPSGVAFFEHEGTGIAVESYEVFGLDHNVLVQEESWGAWVDNPAEGCTDCHRPITLDSPVFARVVLVDPFDENGRRVYKTVTELSGVTPP
jgi:mono/diheme cytochrome c family protein